MGNETLYNYLMGRALDSPEFLSACTEAPLEVLTRAYTKFASRAGRSTKGDYTGRMIAIHKATLNRVFADRQHIEENRERMAQAVEKATEQSLHCGNPIYVYLRGNTIGQSETVPTDAGIIIKCQNGRRYGRHAPRSREQAYGT